MKQILPWVDMENRTPTIDSLLSCFCHCVKFRIEVSVGLRVRVRVGFGVRARVGFRVSVNSMYNIN